MQATLLRPPPPAPNRLRPAATSGLIRSYRDVGYPLPMHSEYVPAWVEVLRQCGLPLDVVVIDFETYFDDTYSMGESKLSTIEYIRDPRFEVTSCAFTRMRADAPFADYEQHTSCLVTEDRVRNELKYLQTQYGENLERCVVVAQNAVFDLSVLGYHFGIHPAHFIDILGLARHLNSRQHNNLATLCKQYKLKEKGDTESSAGKITFRKRYMKPKGRGPKMPVQIPSPTDEQIRKLVEYNTGDNLREWELLTILLPKISNPAVELRLIQHTIELFTKPVLKVDFAKGDELVDRMKGRLLETLPPGMTPEDVSGNKSFEHALNCALMAAGDVPMRYHKVGKKGMMLALAKTDDEREQLLNHGDEAVRKLMEARVAVKSWPLHIARVQRIMSQARANNGVLPVPLKYHGAHTGRASGGERINLQNLGSRGDPLISEVRNMLIAPEGYELVIVDASAIEARVLAWIAGQWDLVEKFANGEEIYCGFASKVLGFPVRKPRKNGGIAAIEQRMAWARNSVGKIGVLGCGYGMGATKTCAYAKGAITLEIAEKIVATYRKENQNIVKFWYDLERAFTYTARYQKPCAMERGLSFRNEPDCDVILTLPNGRELHYPNVKVKVADGRTTLEVQNSLEHSWEHLWGGTLAENVVQATSRDVLMEAMLRLEDQGHHTAHHIHDELVMCVPCGTGANVLKLANAELSKTPTWAPRMALAAEGCVSDRYGKH